MTGKTKVDVKMFSEFPIPDYKQWEKTVAKSLKGKTVDDLVTTTYEGITLKPIYQASDLKGLTHHRDLPGFPSFVRGSTVLGNVKRPWEISQEYYGESPLSFNQSLQIGLHNGQTMINLLLDKNTRFGLDSDEGKQKSIGEKGIPINSLEDLEEAFQNIEMNKLPIFVQSGICTLPFLSLLTALAKKRNISLEELKGFIGFDPIGLLAEFGEIPYSNEQMYELMEKTLQWADDHAPGIRTIFVQGQPYHNAGGSAIEELSFVIATAVEYIREMLNKGYSIDDVAPKMYFSFSIGANVFMEISKLRAARLLWSKVINAFGGNEESQKMYIHARTSHFTKTVYDPYVNMLRATTEAFAGAIGGANSMHVSNYDEAYHPSSQFSNRIARNTQIILQEESHLSKVIDPAGGSWYVESLTSSIAEKAWDLFREIERIGGMLPALIDGKVQSIISEVANKKFSDINFRKETIVGTNRYANIEESYEEKEDFAFRDERVKKVTRYKEMRDNSSLKNQLSRLTSHDIQVDAFIDAAFNGATIGELVKPLQSNASTCLSVEPLVEQRASEKFEELKRASDHFQKKYGKRPKIFFINLGSLKTFKARSDFATSFFNAGGFQVEQNNGYSSIDEAIHAVDQSNHSFVCICGSDESYVDFVPQLASKLKVINKHMRIFLAGNPKSEDMDRFKSSGVTEFIHLKSNCYEILRQLQQEMGVI